MADWQFHMRSFDQSTGTWFGVAHAGCGEVGHRHCGVPGCWNCTVHNNPTGGQASEYSPSDWVINFGAWFNLIVDGI
ncbi:hypothetical protein, partial [Archangium violaceum]|uniref:hypothetical protein n=1 Tax=Archangium violaceum TaxID=83451 RepID=UPI001F47246F